MIPPRDELTVLGAMFARAADVHAVHWRDPRLLTVGQGGEWLKGADWYRGRGRVVWEAAIATGRRAWFATKAKANANAEPGKDREVKRLALSPKLATIIDKSYENVSWAAMRDHLIESGGAVSIVPWGFPCGQHVSWDEFGCSRLG